MSPSTINNMTLALELGYRVRKSNGERILLSDAMRKNYEMTLKAERAKRGVVTWPARFGTCYRFGNKYLNKAQLIQALA